MTRVYCCSWYLNETSSAIYVFPLQHAGVLFGPSSSVCKYRHFRKSMLDSLVGCPATLGYSLERRPKTIAITNIILPVAHAHQNRGTTALTKLTRTYMCLGLSWRSTKSNPL